MEDWKRFIALSFVALFLGFTLSAGHRLVDRILGPTTVYHIHSTVDGQTFPPADLDT